MDLDEFSDDGFDDLPDNALQELEDNAIQLTQAQAHSRPLTQQPRIESPDIVWIEDDDLDTTEVTNDAGVPIGRPAVDNNLPQHQSSQAYYLDSRRSIPPQNPRWNPVVEASNRRSMGHPQQQTNAGLPHQPMYTSQQFQTQSSNFARAQPSQFARPPLPQNRPVASQQSQNQPGDVLSALQQRVRALEDQLKAALGEASIVRSNFVKSNEEHAAEVARLSRINAEQLAKQERIAEAAVAAQQNANTELQFLQRDMREVSDRVRRKEPTGGASGGVTTPKKAVKTWVADGFDEMDIVVSPSKGQGRSRNPGPVALHVGERTPSKGKRKRHTLDSPVMALETHTDSFTSSNGKPEAPAQQAPIVVAPTPTVLFEFLKLVLDHGTYQPTLDILSRFSFADDPETSFSAIIFKRISLMGDPQRPMQLLVDFANLMVGIWTRCQAEQLWEPIKHLLALISFTFSLHASEVAPFVVPNLTAPAQATMCTLAEWQIRIREGEQRLKNDHFQSMKQHIKIVDILSVFYTGALACSTALDVAEDEAKPQATIFWSCISPDLVYKLLSPKQELPDILGMLELLTTSSLPGSIGPITQDKDSRVASHVINHVTSKLTDYHLSVTTREQKCTLRLAALRTLIAFSRYSFGAIELASDSLALPRLVACLSMAIDELYDLPIPSNILPQTSDLSKSTLGTKEASYSANLYRIISQCVFLVHALVTGPDTANIADIGQKLSMAHGGSQRYLLALGRLTFAEEDLVMEAGIDGETVEAAHELLELAVTPDEGEVVSGAFGD
ncbi:uvs-3-like protein [Fusarium heterosporum]|uniref:Uvs-3-like protein n=1 Tax=Fusarium heterosporum TaxID=42747 RepID=A0A8H5WEV0_FUSHE|nr:uvs-3-like protein [Fusarium heterosporum]